MLNVQNNSILYARMSSRIRERVHGDYTKPPSLQHLCFIRLVSIHTRRICTHILLLGRQSPLIRIKTQKKHRNANQSFDATNSNETLNTIKHVNDLTHLYDEILHESRDPDDPVKYKTYINNDLLVKQLVNYYFENFNRYFPFLRSILFRKYSITTNFLHICDDHFHGTPDHVIVAPPFAARNNHEIGLLVYIDSSIPSPNLTTCFTKHFIIMNQLPSYWLVISLLRTGIVVITYDKKALSKTMKDAPNFIALHSSKPYTDKQFSRFPHIKGTHYFNVIYAERILLDIIENQIDKQLLPDNPIKGRTSPNGTNGYYATLD